MRADRCAAWDAARGAARGAQDLLASHTKTYQLKTTFVRIVDIWELGMYPCGVIDGKFVVYTPVDFEEESGINKPAVDVPERLEINGHIYVRV